MLTSIRSRLCRWLVPIATAALVLSGATAAEAQKIPFDAASPGCGKAPTLASGTHTIQSSGQNRSFILRLPDNYSNTTQYRLIFGYHWRGGTANDVDSGGSDGYNWSYYGQRRLAANTAIFVAPQGIGNGWANSGGQDVTFTDDMIRWIENDLCVDTAQRFALGFSYGGGMSYSLACSRANVFRAVAVYSGAQLSGCSDGSRPIAYMGIHGISDSVLNISQGRSLRDRFVRNNGCTPQNPPEPAAGSRTHITTYYSGCRAGYPVVWAAFDGGHSPGPIDGGGEGWRTWTAPEVWKFFTGDTTPQPTGFRLHSESAARCLDVTGASNLNDNGTITSAQGGLCLETTGTTNNSAVTVATCTNSPSQRWARA